MSPYKNFLNAAKDYFNSVPFLRFLLTAGIFIFGLGLICYVLEFFIFAYTILSSIGRILMFAGVLLLVIKQESLALVITSGVASLGCLAGWIYYLVPKYAMGLIIGSYFHFESFLYFIGFASITVFTLIYADKFKQMRAASAAARAQFQPQGIACPQCGAFVPVMAGYCPQCGSKNPVQAQYAAPVQPQYAPPQYTAPVQPQYAAPAPPPPPPVQPQPEPLEATPVAEPEQAAVPKCNSCGSELAPGAAFCGKCGAKQ